MPEPTRRDGGGSGVDPEARVGVLEVFPDGVRRDPEQPRDLAVRSALGHKLEDLGLAICEHIRNGPPRSGATARRSHAKPLEVRQDDVQNVPIAFLKAPVRPIELESGSVCRSARVDPEPDHVLDAERARDVVIELETVELWWGEVVGVHLRTTHRL
jgi:hypothetical protein